MNIETNNATKCDLACEALKTVDDPEIGLNIVDLGLVYAVNFDEEIKEVQLTMTLTTTFCPMGESITSNAMMALEMYFPGYDVDVHLVFDPPWGYHLISEEGRVFLGR
ncbi:MAG: metal-sulfur cluster assembly factor [Chitinophagales bacterium]|nr:metal-sulfur cluster assembly factor [Chitinophagales bacterium]